MNRHSKRMWRCLALSLSLTLLFAALSALFFWRELRDSRLDRHSFDLAVQEDAAILWQEEKAGDLTPGTHRLTVTNREKKSLELRLFCAGEELERIPLSPGEKTTLSVSAARGGALTLLIVPQQGKPCAYLAAEEDVAPVLAQLSTGVDLICVRPLSLGKVTASVPLRFFGSFHFDSLSVDTELSGTIAFAPEESFTAEVKIYAPQCEVFFHQLSPAFPAEKALYYVQAARLNGKAHFNGSVPVSDWTELSRLFQEDALPRLRSGDRVLVTAPITLQGDLTYDGLLSFSLQEELSANGYAIHLNSREAGEIRVEAGEALSPTAELFALEAPEASLIWEGGTAVPSRSVIERLQNVWTYNGEACTLGGRGQAVPQLILSGGEELILKEDVPFQAIGNTLVAALPYQTTASQLKDVPFRLSASGGTAALEGDAIAPGAVVTVTDERGETRRYTLSFFREPKSIPVVYLETDGGAAITSRTQYVSGLFAMDGSTGAYDSVALTHVRIRGRGNSTWKWDKKPFKLHFDAPTSLLGLPAAEEWALFANYADKSLMRNRLALVLASTLSFDYVPTQDLVDVFLNGEYLGVYTLGEHLEEGEGRVEVEHRMNQPDCGYFLEAGGVVSGVDVKGMNYFHAGLVKFVLIKSPEYNSLTTVQFNYIRDYLLAADAAVKAGEGWEDYLDLDTLVDWMILIELSNNTDCAWRRSTYMIKNPGEKVKMGTVWDFDLGFGNFSKDVQDYSVWASTNEEDDYVGTTWSTYLLKDPVFQKAFRVRWQEVRDELLATAMADIDRTYGLVALSAEENFTKWQILGRKVAFERKDTTLYPTYDSQIEYLKGFLTRRAAWIDRAIAQWED